MDGPRGLSWRTLSSLRAKHAYAEIIMIIIINQMVVRIPSYAFAPLWL